MDYLEIFSDNIIKISKEKNMTMYDLSQLTGISSNYLKKIEIKKAKRIKFIYIEKICKVLNTNIKNLFYNE